MNRDLFIINVYCLVVEHFGALKKQYHLRRQGGFVPALTDEAVITMEVCGEYFKLNQDKDLYRYFATHYRHFFPPLPERTSFIRQAACLWQWKDWLQLRLVQVSGQAADPVPSIDTWPWPVCTYSRASRAAVSASWLITALARPRNWTTTAANGLVHRPQRDDYTSPVALGTPP